MNNFTLNCKGNLLTINKPVVMGIVNLTPDSFSDGGMYKNSDAVLNAVEQMLNEGAKIIDIGGQSTRPNAEKVSEAEELNRVLLSVKKIHTYFPEAILSIDTFRSKVAEAVIQEGVSIINDITAGEEDERILEIAARYTCPFIMMHRNGSFEVMHNNFVADDLISGIMDYFIKKISHLKSYGITDIIVDPGFGFSKTIDQNYYLLKHLNVFAMLDRPILAGLSRKSMLYNLLTIEPGEAQNATSVANLVALQQGATILRVHDVKEAVQCIKIYEQLEFGVNNIS